ncbi:hypothetical protein NCCP2331_19820 [Sporosarcina sp. NCCP-2331]|nr:hypothetical protein NCCP2331_19820 [Sporosarcina sp. NCCP-2331]GLB55953.1 hypothetical protein NCCP2378_17400 [Sporosarcina sp. NCCP-2378]
MIGGGCSWGEWREGANGAAGCWIGSPGGRIRAVLVVKGSLPAAFGSLQCVFRAAGANGTAASQAAGSV